ncbi:haloacid dehalogenase [Iodidimonas nitroreducens]|uniref:Haloacid dehalogenase n=1 Tax=Iodidimonas nitroreducens TaxID=1236968 RepID=A0A5A7N9Y1_9PROT|nr:HAD-IA family hydrolase [Iodidimonas nitroreducens]GER04918.1 haloacid dehalogenase [Iodidimonas nitroreducens]
MMLAVFDCDGTLVDSQHVIISAMRMAFAANDRAAPSDAQIRQIVGLSLPEAMTALLQGGAKITADRDPDPALPGLLADAYKQAFVDLRARDGHRQEPLYPGIKSTLDHLRNEGVLLAVATGKSIRGLNSILAHHNLADYFISLQTADTHPSKPHPSMLLAAMDEAGMAPEKTILIGDTSYDILMARAAGAWGLGVSWGYHATADLLAAGAHAISRNGDELPHDISNLLAKATA